MSLPWDLHHHQIPQTASTCTVGRGRRGDDHMQRRRRGGDQNRIILHVLLALSPLASFSTGIVCTAKAGKEPGNELEANGLHSCCMIYQ